jgi:hypothetical protein
MNTHSMFTIFRSLAAALVVAASSNAVAAVVYSSAGANAAAITSTVDAFRAALGALNPNVVGSFGSGRREINWDGVPDAFSAPNNLPANFFNVNSPRGVVLATPGTGFAVSATAASGTPVQFGNIDPNYASFFEPFTQQRLFTALGSTITDVNLFVPGSSTAAVSRGFGVVFSDVDLDNSTSLQFFDRSGTSLGTFFAPNFAGNETFSFLGVDFGSAVVGRVRITSGNQILAAGNTSNDLVVMDDFIFAEPNAAVPEPATWLLAALALILLRARRGSAQNPS